MNRHYHRNLIIKLVLFYFCFAVSNVYSSTLPQNIIDEINTNISLWEKFTVSCQSIPGISPDPSMEEEDDPTDNCSASDQTTYNGVLGTVDERGRTANKRSQISDGRVWRSPFRAAHHNCNLRHVQKGLPFDQCADNTLSPDGDLGFQLYAAVSNDKAALQAWLNWIDSNLPCVANKPFSKDCLVRGLPRYCFASSCTLRPIDAKLLRETATKLGLSIPDSIANYERHVDEFLGALAILLPVALPIAEFGAAINHASLSDLIKSESQIDGPGFPLHLNGLRILLLRDILQSGDTTKLNAAAAESVSKQKQNPFFLFLRDGATEDVWKLVKQVCPTTESDIPKIKSAWAWEKEDTEEDRKKTSLWDCIFMGKLLLRQ
jgi:hypothetical protein